MLALWEVIWLIGIYTSEFLYLSFIFKVFALISMPVRLMLLGHQVICLDNFYTGSQRNIEHWIGHPNFQLIRHDVIGILCFFQSLVLCSRYSGLTCLSAIKHYITRTVYGWSGSNLPSSLSSISATLPEQSCQDYQDWIPGHLQHARPRQTHKGPLLAHVYLRCVFVGLAPPAVMLLLIYLMHLLPIPLIFIELIPNSHHPPSLWQL